MKKNILLMLLFTAFSGLGAFACDICGCGVGSYYLGILPDFKKRFIGLRYQQKSLLTHLSPDGSRSYLTTDETYRSYELWGAWNMGSKFRVVGFVPLNQVQKINQGVTQHKTGLGDIALVGYYKLFGSQGATEGKTSRFVSQSLWVGGGIKLPTGHYDPNDESNTAGSQNTYQLGTASVDFTLNAMYDLRVQDVGVNVNASYKINSYNRYHYQYGNKLTTNLLGYYKFRVANITIAPNAGAMWETAANDHRNSNSKVDESGGWSVMGTGGIEVNINRIAFGANYQVPVSQSLAAGMVKGGRRGMVHIAFAF